jgi:hypothetical protein
VSGRWDRGLELDSAGAGDMSSGLDHKRDSTRLAKSRLKRGQNCSREGQSGATEIQFLGFIHFPRKRTLTGWELLCRMTKVTSEQFRYGREHVRVWKCRKTRSKSGTKSGSKTRPGQHPQPRKRPYTGKSSLQRASKKGSKIAPKSH